MPKLQASSLEILRDRHTCNQLDLLAIGKELEHLRLEILLIKVQLLQSFQVLLDSLKFVVGVLFLLLLRLFSSWIFLKVNVSGVIGVAIGAIKLAQFEYELDHLSRDEELLEDRRLLSVLGEDKELCEELKGLEVLKRETLLEGLVEMKGQNWVHCLRYYMMSYRQHF